MIIMVDDEFSPDQKRAYDLRHYPVRPHVGVGGIILWENQVCLIKRKYSPNKGKWAIPGGHLRLGENAAQGALRECIEETGLALQIGEIASVIDKIDYDDQGRIEYHYVLCDYWMKIQNTSIESCPPQPIPQSDVLDARFVLLEDLKNYDLTRTVKELFWKLNLMP